MIEGISSNPSENQEVNKHTRWHNNIGCEVTSIGTYHHDEKFTESLSIIFQMQLLNIYGCFLKSYNWLEKIKRVQHTFAFLSMVVNEGFVPGNRDKIQNWNFINCIRCNKWMVISGLVLIMSILKLIPNIVWVIKVFYSLASCEY